MKRTAAIKRISILLSAAALMVFSSFNAPSPDEMKFYALGNKTPDNMTFNELRSVLKGEQQRWKDGTKITLALMKSSTPVGSMVSKKIFFMTDEQLNKYFLALV